MTQTEPDTHANDAAPVALVIDGARVATASGETRELLGREAAELGGRDLVEIVHPDDLAGLVAVLTSHGVAGHTNRVVARLRHRDDRWIAVAVEVQGAAGAAGGRTTVSLRASDDTDGIRSLAELMQGPPTMLLTCDDRSIVAVSASSVEVLGYAPDEVITGYLDMVHPDDLGNTVDLTAVIARSAGTIVRQVGRIRHADGSWRIVETRAVNLLDDPSCNATFVSMHEVPQPASYAHEIGRFDRFQAIVNQNADPVLVLTREGMVTYASPLIENLTGRPAVEAVGEAAATLVHPDERRAVVEWFESLVDASGATASRRMRITNGDSWVWVEARVTNYFEEETLQGILASLRDITAQVELENEILASEARFRDRESWYRALVQHSFEMTVVADNDLVITWVSPSALDLLGWEPSAVVGDPGLDYIHPDDTQMALDHLDQVAAGLEPRPLTTLRVKQADGRYRWVDISASDRRDDPSVNGIILNLRDASARIEAEEALQRSEGRYRQLVQNSTDVVQIMSPSGEVIWVSPAVESVLGWTPTDLLGHPTGGMAGFQGRDGALAAFLEVLDQPGSTSRTICQVQHANGEMRWIDLVLTNHLDEPDINGIVATYRDFTERVRIEEALRKSEERFRSLADSSPLGIFQLDLDARCTYVNDRWCEIVGQSAERARGDGWRAMLMPDQVALLDDTDLGAVAAVDTLAVRGQFVHGDGTVRWSDVRTAPLTDDAGRRVGTVGTIEDVTDRVEAQRETERLTTILEATPDLVGIANRRGHLLYLNSAARSFFGYDEDVDTRQIRLLPFFPLESVERWQAEVQPSLRARDTWQGELLLTDREGRTVPVSAVLVAHRGPDHHIEQISVTARDISDRKALEARLEHEATHDPLTGLPNRTLLLDRLEVAIGRARRQHRRLAALFLDLDHFKVVNDSLGHSTGDQLLAAIAARLTDHVRPGDTVARFGGDEFVIICEEVESIYEVEDIARRIANAVAEPVWIGEAEVFVTSSVGIALASDLHQTPEQLLRDADAAMYQAKAKGRSRHEVFDSRLRTRALDRLEVESALRRALVRHELRVHYQPCFDLANGKVTGVEALLRWEHPQRGLLLPAEFLRIAEETGLIVPIGAWVARQACRQIQRLRLELPEYADLQVAVNLSARQIGHRYLVDEIAKVISDTGTRPDTLVLEITESVLMDDIPNNTTTLRRLKELGVSIAIDDFGTGYSSLAYLRRFPVDVLKVDRSFVTGLGNDPEDAAIANAVITLAHTLGLVALAEGVESEAQRAELQRLGCDQAQGFLLGRPMPPSDLTDFLVNRRARDAVQP